MGKYDLIEKYMITWIKLVSAVTGSSEKSYELEIRFLGKYLMDNIVLVNINVRDQKGVVRKMINYKVEGIGKV